MRLARIAIFFLLQFFLATISTNCCDDLPLLCTNLYIFCVCLLSICCLLCIMSNFFHFLFHPAPFFHVLFSCSVFSFILYFNVNKCALCEYYVICQTYSIIQFVHTEFHFVALTFTDSHTHTLISFFFPFLSTKS